MPATCATGALQAGLQPAEQRQAAGMERTTLQQTWQQRRVNARVAGMGPRLREAAQRQGAVLERMREMAPLVRQAVGQAIEAARPLLRQAVERLRQRQELAAIRAELLKRRMQAWREAPGHATAGQGMERLTEADLRREIGVPPEPALRHAAAEAQRQDVARQQQRDQAARHASGPSLGR